MALHSNLAFMQEYSGTKIDLVSFIRKHRNRTNVNDIVSTNMVLTMNDSGAKFDPAPLVITAFFFVLFLLVLVLNKLYFKHTDMNVRPHRPKTQRRRIVSVDSSPPSYDKIFFEEKPPKYDDIELLGYEAASYRTVHI